MNEEDITVLAEIITDVKVEVEAICLAIQQNDIPRETIKSLRSEVDSDAIRKEVEGKLKPALST